MSRSPYELIKSSDESLWREGLSALLIEHSSKSCAAIITVLTDRTWHKREAAAKVLLEWGPEVVDEVINSLGDENPDQLYWLLYILGHIATEQAVETIKNYLRHHDSEVRGYAIRSIACKKTLAHARLLYPMLNDKNWAVRKLSFEQLLTFGVQILPDLRSIITTPGKSAHNTVIALFVKIGQDSIISELRQFYARGNFSLKFLIISALGELATPNAIDFIVTCLADDSWAIRKNAAEQLQNLGSKVFDRLTADFSRSDSIVRKQIISLLVKMLSEKSITLLQKLLAAQDHELKLLALDNLAKLKSDDSTTILITCLSDSDRIISDYAAECLSRKSYLNMELLMENLSSNDENLRFQIIRIIGSIGGMALAPIIKILRSGQKQERLFLLGVLQRILPDDKLIEVLIDLLGDEDWPIRNTAANCLIQYGEASVPALVTALNDSSDDVCFWSRKALLAIGPQAVIALKKMLEEGTNPSLMPHIVSALLSMNHPDAIPAVIKFLEISDEMRIKSVFDSIPSITSKDVVSTILNLLTHPDEKIVKWLSHLLRKVEDSSLRKSVFLGFSHSNERVRYFVFEAVKHWDTLTENDVKILCRQLPVEKNIHNLTSLSSIIARFSYESCVNAVRDYLNQCEPHMMLDLMLATAINGTAEHLEMLDTLLNTRSEVITLEDVDKVGKILGHVYRKNPEGLIQALNAPGMAYRLCTVIALDSIDDRRIAFAIIENLMPNEDARVMNQAIKTLAKFFFNDDFRLKGAITDFLLSLGPAITQPLSEHIETLENDLDRKALVDMVESVGGTVDPELLRAKTDKTVFLSDTHLDDVLEKRRHALEELERYDEVIKTSHTRQLAIMFTDVKGYTAFSSKASLSEVMSMLKQHDEILKPVFEKHEGQALKKIGDAFLVVFESDTNAVLAAMEIQRKLKEFNTSVNEERQLAIRIAINSGSVIRTENDVLGDAVNLASRLESVGDAFEIIISEFTLERIEQSVFDIEPYGVHQLKGIKHPIKAFKVKW